MRTIRQANGQTFASNSQLNIKHKGKPKYTFSHLKILSWPQTYLGQYSSLFYNNLASIQRRDTQPHLCPNDTKHTRSCQRTYDKWIFHSRLSEELAAFVACPFLQTRLPRGSKKLLRSRQVATMSGGVEVTTFDTNGLKIQISSVSEHFVFSECLFSHDSSAKSWRGLLGQVILSVRDKKTTTSPLLKASRSRSSRATLTTD